MSSTSFLRTVIRKGNLPFLKPLKRVSKQSSGLKGVRTHQGQQRCQGLAALLAPLQLLN